ncbi:MAG: heme biosynthesis protein HemY [Pseudomonadota bacterium]
MFRLIGFFIVTGALMFGATWLFDNDHGTPVTIEWYDGTVLQPPLPFAVLLLLGLIVLGVVLFELLRILFGYPARWFAKRRVDRRLRGFDVVSKGLIAAAAGDFTEAKELRKDAERYLGDRAPATLLLAAQTAEAEGNHEVAQIKYRQMLKRPETRLLGLRGLMSDAMASGDEDAALDLARQAFAQRPYTEWVVSTLFELLTRKALWSEAFRRVDDLKLNKVVEPEEAQRLRGVLKMLMAQDMEKEGDEAEAMKAALDATRRYRGFAPAAVYASALAHKLDRPKVAREVLEESWARQPHPEVAQAYAALVPNENAESRLARFERLAQRNPTHRTTLKTLIELALADGQVDRALRYAAQVPGSSPTAGTLQAAIEAYRAKDPASPKIGELEALAAQAPAEEAWVCEKTGQVVDAWSPYGPTGAFDTLRWQSPPRIATLVARTTSAEAEGFGGRTVDLEAMRAG